MHSSDRTTFTVTLIYTGLLPGEYSDIIRRELERTEELETTVENWRELERIGENWRELERTGERTEKRTGGNCRGLERTRDNYIETT